MTQALCDVASEGRVAPQEAKEPNRLSHSVARSAARDQARLDERDVS